MYGDAKDDKKLELTKSKRKRKQKFYLADGDADEFIYHDLYYISEIKDELNRICTVNEVKKVTTGDIGEYLLSEGLIYKEDREGVLIKLPTKKGLEYGIKIEEKISQSGMTYKLMKYPPKVQKMIVDYLVGSRDDEENGDETKGEGSKTFDRVEFNRLRNRPDGAGASWDKEEDARLDQEYESGMSISAIAQLHSRTTGGIRARLKKHGLIE